MVLDRNAFFESVNAEVGEDVSDEKIKFLEDMQDTYNDLERRAEGGDAENWKNKYLAMKTKYKKRFGTYTNGNMDFSEDQEKTKEEEEEYKAKNISISDLFGLSKEGGREL